MRRKLNEYEHTFIGFLSAQNTKVVEIFLKIESVSRLRAKANRNMQLLEIENNIVFVLFTFR